MQTFVTNESIKETKIIDDINKKRSQPSNLFGLGLVSLIAAFGGSSYSEASEEEAADHTATTEGSEASETEAEVTETTEATEEADLIFLNQQLASDIISAYDVPILIRINPPSATDDELKAPEFSGSEIGYDVSYSDLDKVFIDWSYRHSRLTIKAVNEDDFAGASSSDPSTFLKIGGNSNYDMVIRAPYADKDNYFNKGAIYIAWDVYNYRYSDKTIDLSDPSNATAGVLSIYGENAGDFIGQYAPEFIKIGRDIGYDMVIRSPRVNKFMGFDEGAIYILWDVADYAAAHKTIDLGNLYTVDSEALKIQGANQYDYIGTYAPEFLKIGGRNGYDMVIRAPYADRDNYSNTGAIYIVWDLDRYSGSIKSIDLGRPSNANGGVLAIQGASADDKIGTYAPEFLKIGGEDSYDILISSRLIDNGTKYDAGAIYIVWDIDGYSGSNNTIDLGSPSADDNRVLAIYGNSRRDYIGEHAPEFKNIGGRNGYDMVIRSPSVDRYHKTDAGAIYIVWDIDGYSDSNNTIDLGNLSGSTSGVLAIYGRNLPDYIGRYAPEFKNINTLSTTHNDMIIRSEFADSSRGNKRDLGAIYILWDVGDYAGSNKTIDLGSPSAADNGALTIYGANQYDKIGIHAPEFQRIYTGLWAGVDDNRPYNMIIRSERVNHGNEIDTGAIYILWNVTDYAGSNKTIDLGSPSAADNGVLTIYGANAGDQIGIHAYDFMYSRVPFGWDRNIIIYSEYVNHGNEIDTGAIYIVWDVRHYRDSNKTIDLGRSSTADRGILTIYGANQGDGIGAHAPQFFNIGGEENKKDMVITSKDTASMYEAEPDAKGAIYILWDVADYTHFYKQTNKTIDLGNIKKDATSGSLTIYTRTGDFFTEDDSTSVLSADINDEGKDDLIFQSQEMTHILIGENMEDANFYAPGEHQTFSINYGSNSTNSNPAYFFNLINSITNGTIVHKAGFSFKSDELEDLGGFTVDGVQAAWDMLT